MEQLIMEAGVIGSEGGLKLRPYKTLLYNCPSDSCITLMATFQILPIGQGS